MTEAELRVLYLSGKRRKELPLLRGAQNIRFREVNLHLRSDLGWRVIVKLLRLHQLKRKFQPDVILMENAGAYFLLAKWILGGRTPIIMRIKGDISQEFDLRQDGMPLTEKIVRCLNYQAAIRLYHRAAGFLPISNWLQQRLTEILDQPAVSIVVPNTFDKYKDKSVKPYDTRRPFVLTVFNFNFWAKVAPLYEAIPIIAEMLRQLELDWVILGHGVFWKQCFDQAEPYRDCINLPGFVDPKRYYAAAPRFVLYISGLDGFANAVLEAYCHQLPVIMNVDCPATEFVLAGETGFTVDLQDREATMRYLALLAQDDPIRAKLGQAGNQFVEEKFNESIVAAQFQAGIKEIIERWRSR